MGVTRAGEFIRMNMVYNKSAICKYYISKFIGRRVHNIEMTSYWTAIRRRTDDVTKSCTFWDATQRPLFYRQSYLYIILP